MKAAGRAEKMKTAKRPETVETMEAEEKAGFPDTAEKPVRTDTAEKPVRAETGRKEDRRVRRTKKLLNQALTELLERKQIQEITVKELTDLADMNRGTFYLYYRDIYDMLEKTEDSLFDALNAILSQHENEGIHTSVRPILLDLFRFVEENQEMCRVLLSPNGDMNFLHRLNEVIREKCRRFWPNLQGEREEADYDYHYSFAVFGYAGLVRAWVSRGCPESAESMASLAADITFHGVLPRAERG